MTTTMTMTMMMPTRHSQGSFISDALLANIRGTWQLYNNYPNDPDSA